jgi:anthranilate/para-aminobenzoate synthase component I
VVLPVFGLCWGRAEEKTLTGMSLEERQTLHQLVTKVRGNLDPSFDTGQVLISIRLF